MDFNTVIFDGDVTWDYENSLYHAEFEATGAFYYGVPKLTLNGVEYIGEYIPEGEVFAFFSSEHHAEENTIASIAPPREGIDTFTIVSVIEPQPHIIFTMSELPSD